jgi:hypothetical protein
VRVLHAGRVDAAPRLLAAQLAHGGRETRAVAAEEEEEMGGGALD